MSALRKPIESAPYAEPRHEAEVIYLVIPPHASEAQAPKPWTLLERVAFTYLDLRLRARETPVGQAIRAVGLVAGYTFMAIPILVGGYLLKSAIGFDLFPRTHMGGYVREIEWRP